jgi:hypothetical protein
LFVYVCCVSRAIMVKALTAFLMISMLLFGSIGVPALADAGSAGHAVEIVDLDCHSEEKNDAGQDENAPKAPAGHVDHHHCSVAVPQSVSGVGATNIYTGNQFALLAIRAMISHQAAPPTQPPSA